MQTGADGAIRWRRARTLAVVPLLALILLDAAASLPRGAHPYLGDMKQFLASGRAVWQGSNPYAFLDTGPIFGTPSVGTNLNPPLSLLLFAPLSRLDPSLAIVAWTALTLLVYAVTTGFLFARYPEQVTASKLAWVFGLGGFWYTIVFGQVYVLALALAVAAWLLSERGHAVAAGAVMGGLIALKPNFAIWLLLLWLAGQRRQAISGGVAGAVLGVVPALLFGPRVYLQWYAAQHAEAPMIAWWPHNGSLVGAAARAGLPSLEAPLAILLVCGAAWWTYRHRPEARDVHSLALIVSVLASPLAWMGYQLFALPVLLSRPWSLTLRLAALLMLVPGWLTWSLAPGPPWAMALVGILSTTPFVLVLAALLCRGRAGRARGQPQAARSFAPAPR